MNFKDLRKNILEMGREESKRLIEEIQRSRLSKKVAPVGHGNVHYTVSEGGNVLIHLPEDTNGN